MSTDSHRARLSVLPAYDAKCSGITLPPEVPMTVAERAYTSPIWYTPEN